MGDPRRAADTRVFDRVLHRLRELAHLLLIRVRGREQDDKEGKEQGNKIGIGHQPTLVVGAAVAISRSTVHPIFASFSGWTAVSAGCSSTRGLDRQASSCSWMRRGLVPA